METTHQFPKGPNPEETNVTSTYILLVSRENIQRVGGGEY